MAMTPKAFKEKMQEIYKEGNEKGDIEGAHMEADDLMMEVLDDLGYGDGVDIFKSAPKWYA